MATPIGELEFAAAQVAPVAAGITSGTLTFLGVRLVGGPLINPPVNIVAGQTFYVSLRQHVDLGVLPPATVRFSWRTFVTPPGGAEFELEPPPYVDVAAVESFVFFVGYFVTADLDVTLSFINVATIEGTWVLRIEAYAEVVG